MSKSDPEIRRDAILRSAPQSVPRSEKLMLIASEADLVAAFRARRRALGITGEEADFIAGTQERYVAKLENPDKPWGRRAINPMFWLWLGALKLVLVAVPVEHIGDRGQDHHK